MNKRNVQLLFWGVIAMLFYHSKAYTQVTPTLSQGCILETSEQEYRKLLEDIPQIEEFTASTLAHQRWPEQTIPVYFTVFRNDDGSFAGREIDEYLVQEALDRLDSLFSPINFDFVHCGEINYVDHSGLAAFSAHRHLKDFSYRKHSIERIHPQWKWLLCTISRQCQH